MPRGANKWQDKRNICPELNNIDDQLPDPENKEFCLTMASANASVYSTIEKMTAGSSRGPYLYLTPTQKFQLEREPANMELQGHCVTYYKMVVTRDMVSIT